jgi:hypothetical protein
LKPFFGADENVLKQSQPILTIDEIVGIGMLALILRAIYRKFITTALPGVFRQGATQ